ncbi:MAG: nicotinamide riboside transporter PnuC [Bacteroidota bacterium]
MEISPIEYVVVGLNLAYIILAARENIWCWPIGIVASALSIWLFLISGLYAESILFTYYVIIGFYGWWAWSKGKNSEKDDLPIVTWSARSHVIALSLGSVLTAILFFSLSLIPNSEMPLLDSLTTIFSFIATWMFAKKVLENWIYWIVLNFLTTYLYFSRDLKIYGILMILYVILSVYGYISWRKDQKLQIQKTRV